MTTDQLKQRRAWCLEWMDSQHIGETVQTTRKQEIAYIDEILTLLGEINRTEAGRAALKAE